MTKNILENATMLLSRLQGIGPRSSKRILLDLMKKKDALLLPLINALTELHESIACCSKCFNLDVLNPCGICSNPLRNQKTICVIEDVSSLWAIEKTKVYDGLYFVLGGNLSAQKNKDSKVININTLINRIENENITEVILAISATIEGQITSNYIVDSITNKSVKISMLAQGIPIGGEIDYLDDITISTALKFRKNI